MAKTVTIGITQTQCPFCGKWVDRDREKILKHQERCKRRAKALGANVNE